jgi:uncharacterized protein YbaA (DUF1428 family)
VGQAHLVSARGEAARRRDGVLLYIVYKQRAGETVFFSYIVYKSRAHRDRVNARVMKDKRVLPMTDPKTFPFDGKRMIYGGFRVLVDK